MESEYIQLMRSRFEKDEMSYNEESDFLALINGPEAFRNEPEMLSFAKEHPDATMEDMIDYWDSITPPGLPPGMTEADLADDEDD